MFKLNTCARCGKELAEEEKNHWLCSTCETLEKFVKTYTEDKETK